MRFLRTNNNLLGRFAAAVSAAFITNAAVASELSNTQECFETWDNTALTEKLYLPEAGSIDVSIGDYTLENFLSKAANAKFVVVGDTHHLSGELRQEFLRLLPSLNISSLGIEGQTPEKYEVLNNPDKASELENSADLVGVFSHADLYSGVLDQGISVHGIDATNAVQVSIDLSDYRRRVLGSIHSQISELLTSVESSNPDLHQKMQRLDSFHLDTELTELAAGLSDKDLSYVNQFVTLSRELQATNELLNNTINTLRYDTRDSVMASNLDAINHASMQSVAVWMGINHSKAVAELLERNHTACDVVSFSIVPLNKQPEHKFGLINGHPVVFVHDNSPYPDSDADFVKGQNRVGYKDIEGDGYVGYDASRFNFNGPSR